VVITLVYHVWMYVHIKAVTCATFPSKQDFLPKLIRQKYKRKLSNTYIFLVYSPIMFVMYYLTNLIWLWTMLVEKMQKEVFVTM